MEAIRSKFPIFSAHPDLVFLDSAATAQKPQSVISCLCDFYSHDNAPVHRSFYALAETATVAYEAVRQRTASFFNAQYPSEIVFTAGATAGCNAVAFGWLANVLSQGDEIAVSVLEHHSSLLPMVEVARACGATVRFMPVDSSGELLVDQALACITSKTKLVVCTAGSNVVGISTPLLPLISKAQSVGAAFFVDAAQIAPRRVLNVQELGIDFLVCSAHKMGGPTGLGVLYVHKDRQAECRPWLLGGSMVHEVHLEEWSPTVFPAMWEAGTPPIAQVIAFGEVLAFLEKLCFEEISTHEAELSKIFVEGLLSLQGATIVGNPERLATQGHLVSFFLSSLHAHDVAAYLAERNICVRSGYHCAQPLHEWLGIPQTVRASWYLYTSKDDVYACLSALQELLA